MGEILLDARTHGMSAGTAVTMANAATALGMAPTSEPVLAGGGTVTYEGTDRVLFTDPTGASGVARLDYAGKLSGGTFSINVLLPAASTPDAEHRYVVLRNAAGDNDVVRVAIAEAGGNARRVRVFNQAGTRLHETTLALPDAAPSRFHVGGDLAAGQLRVQIFTADGGYSTTPAYDSGTLTVSWSGQTSIGEGRLGAITSAAAVSQAWHWARILDTTTAAVAPSSASTKPVIEGYGDLVGADLTGFVVGGSGSGYSIVSATQVGGTSVGAISISGLRVFLARPTVDAATVRVVAEDGAGTDSDPFDVVFPVVLGGGPLTWDGAAWT